MFKLTIYNEDYSDTLNTELCKFVSFNIAELVIMQIELCTDSLDGFEDIFPDNYINTHSIDDCKTVLKTIYDRLSSYVMYEEFTILQQYTLPIMSSPKSLIFQAFL